MPYGNECDRCHSLEISCPNIDGLKVTPLSILTRIIGHFHLLYAIRCGNVA